MTNFREVGSGIETTNVDITTSLPKIISTYEKLTMKQGKYCLNIKSGLKTI